MPKTDSWNSTATSTWMVGLDWLLSKYLRTFWSSAGPYTFHTQKGIRSAQAVSPRLIHNFLFKFRFCHYCSREAWGRRCLFARRTSLPCKYTRHTSCTCSGAAKVSFETSLQIFLPEMPRANPGSLVYGKFGQTSLPTAWILWVSSSGM